MLCFQLEQSVNFIDIRNIESPEPSKVIENIVLEIKNIAIWYVPVYVARL